MDSSNLITSAANITTTSYQEIPLSSFLNLPQPPPPPPPPPASSSPSPSFFDPLPSYLPTFHHQEPPSSSSSSHPPPPPPPPQPPSSSKKRPRASRRAPTTVLTTDTSNFRAMVQEFTGFPAPPFAAAPRLSSSSPYFLPRPFAHNLPSPSHANAAAYPFATSTATLIGLHNHNIILAPPLTPPPQFGDHLTSFVANSDGLQQQQAGSLPSWADDQQDHQDQFQQLEKRRKTKDNGGVVESWIHSSD